MAVPTSTRIPRSGSNLCACGSALFPNQPEHPRPPASARMKNKLREILIGLARSPGFWFVVIAVAWTLYHALEFWPNNFLIYRTASANLFVGRDLYVPYPARHFDLFKYSPTF